MSTSFRIYGSLIRKEIVKLNCKKSYYLASETSAGHVNNIVGPLLSYPRFLRPKFQIWYAQLILYEVQ